jgi:3',5'-cyclic AMP phosphodiesterase CpdA
MRIVQLADLHFGTEDPRAIDAAASRISVLEPDVIVVSGDMTQRGKHREFQTARDWIDSLNRPTLIVPGNHDTPLLNMLSRARRPFQRHHAYFPIRTDMLQVGSVSIDGLNTARGWQARSNWAEGSVRLDHLAELVSRDAPADSLRMLACHHPFRSPTDAPLRTRTRRGALASEMLAASDISVLLTGHVHTPHAELIREATGNYIAISAGTLSTRLRNALPAFNSLDVTTSEVSVETHDFDGMVFRARSLGQWRTSDLLPHAPSRSATIWPFRRASRPQD